MAVRFTSSTNIRFTPAVEQPKPLYKGKQPILPTAGVGGFAEELSKGVVRGFLNVGKGVVGTAEWIIPGKQETLLEMKRRIGKSAERLPMTHSGAAAWGGRVLGEAIPYMGTAMVAALGAGAAAGAGVGAAVTKIGAGAAAVPLATAAGEIFGAASVGFAVEGDTAYDEAIKGGATEKQAQTERILVGTINAALEAWGINKLLRFHDVGKHSLRNFVKLARAKAWKLAGKELKGFGASTLKLSIQEAAEEFAQEGVSIGIPAALRKDYPKLPSGKPDVVAIGERLLAAALGGGFAGAVLGGGRAALAVTPQLAAPTETETQEAIQIIENSKLPLVQKQVLMQELEGLSELAEAKPAAEGETYYHGTSVVNMEKIKRGEFEGGRYNAISLSKDKTVSEWHAKRTSRKEGKTGGEGIVTPISLSKDAKIFTTKDVPQDMKERFLSETEIDTFARLNGFDGIDLAQLEKDGIVKAQLGPESEVRIFNPNILRVGGLTVDIAKQNQRLNSALDEVVVLKPGQEAAIKRQKAIKFEAYADILKQVPNATQASYIALRALSGKELIEIAPLKNQISEQEIEPFFDRVRSSTALETEKIHMNSALQKLFFEGKIPARHEIDALRILFPKETINRLITIRKKVGKDKWDTAMDAIQVPRSILASADLSAPGRQGLLLLPLVPKQWIKSVGKGYRAFASPKYTSFVDLQIRTDPRYESAKKAGLELTRVGGVSESEEIFRGELAHKIPYLGKVIKASERAYVTTLNSLRFHAYKHFAQQWEGTGKSTEDYKTLAAFINHATGRGDVKKLKKFMPTLNAAFFAPRLLIGRVQVLTDLFTTTSPVRKIVAKDLLSFVSGGLLALWLASLIPGVTVEKDPRSSDFGKIRFGKSRIDFWTGYTQIARYLAQFLSGQTKSAETKRLFKTKRGEVIWRFIQSKLSPPAGLSVDLIRGETFLGKQLKPEKEVIAREVFERFVPLFIQDVVDAARYEGLTSMSIITPLALHGIGAMTYPATSGSETARLKETLSKQYFGEGWDKIGPKAQELLKTAEPQIGLMETQAKNERESYKFMARMLEEQQVAGRKVLKQLPQDIQREINIISIEKKGLSRRVSSNWYLNEKRYKQYQEDTAKLLNKLLPKIIHSSIYNALPLEAKKLLVEEVIDRAKKAARNRITNQANIRDLEKLVL